MALANYYNTYDKNNRYKELLAIPGRVLQSRELNELQSMIFNDIKEIGNAVFKNGQIITGMQPVIRGHSVILTKGKLFLDGRVHDVPEKELVVTLVGTERIGARVNRTTITSEDDKSLKDPASGFDNYQEDGCGRLKESIQIILQNESNIGDSVTLYTLEDGVLVANGESVDANNDEYIARSTLTKILAERTYDSEGNFIVSGLNVIDPHVFDDEHNYVNVEQGTAYVEGYKAILPTNVTLGIDRVTEVDEIKYEHHIINDSGVYTLNNSFVTTIDNAFIIKQNTSSPQTRSVTSLKDSLYFSSSIQTNITKILRVYDESTTYVEGRDFELSQDKICWYDTTTSRRPQSGATYYVTYQYSQPLSYGNGSSTDMTLDVSVDGESVVTVQSHAGAVIGQSFIISYKYKLHRLDTIVIDRNANLFIIKGQASSLTKVKPPFINLDRFLPLANVLTYPTRITEGKIEIIINKKKVLDSDTIFSMLTRLANLEYNVATDALDVEAQEGEDATTLQGIFSEGFYNYLKADIGHSEFTAFIDTVEKCATLPFTARVDEVKLNTLMSTCAVEDTILDNDYTERKYYSQSAVSSYMRVNPYNAFAKNPDIKITPSVDNWVDVNNVTVYDSSRNTYESVTSLPWLANGSYSTESGWWTATMSSVSTTETLIDYMRENTIKIEVAKYPPSTDNIWVSFNGSKISVTPLANRYKGTIEGHLRADETGTAIGTFKIPANTRCGTVDVITGCDTFPNFVGRATYTANGIRKTNTTTTWKKSYTIIQPADPLAQSFQFDDDNHILTSVGFYFAHKQQDEPITVQIRGITNGYPDNTVYASKTLQSHECLYSDDCSKETKVTFDDPVFIEKSTQYCFVIISNSDYDSVYVARTGEVDIKTKQELTKNAYLNGMLFISSNGISWTAEQSADLTFNLYVASYTHSSTATFNTLQADKADKVFLIADTDSPQNCSIQWQVKPSTSTTSGSWQPIENCSMLEFNNNIDSVDMKANLVGTTNISPAISTDGLVVACMKNDLEATYVSRTVFLEDGFNHLSVYVDFLLPSGTSAEVYYATDEVGLNWTKIDKKSVKPSKADNDYKEYCYETNFDETQTSLKLKIVMNTLYSYSVPKMKRLRAIFNEV